MRFKSGSSWLLACLFVSTQAAEEFAISKQRLPGAVELLVRVLGDNNSGVRAGVALSMTGLTELIATADEFGNAYFHGIAPGRYTLVVRIGESEIYRESLSLKRSEGFRSILVRAPVPISTKPETVSVDDLSVPANARKYYDDGIAATHLRNWQKAHDAFREALRLHPKYARAYNALGVVLAFMGRSASEIEAALRNAVRFGPRLAEAHFNLGKLLLDSARPTEARQELQQAVDLDSRHESANELLVESMLMTGDEDAAVLHMRSLDRGGVKHHAWLHIETAVELEGHGKFELAAEQYQLVLADDASSAERSAAELGLTRLRDR